MRPGLGRWLTRLLRYGLCAAAVVFLFYSVSWHDTVALRDAPGAPVRLLRWDETELVVERDGRPQTITWEQVHYEGDVPAVTYGISGIVRRTHLGQVLLAILIFLPVPLLQSIRLVWMLAVQDVPLSYWNAIKFSYAGNFFNFALPGTVGGDVVKAYYVAQFTHRKTEAVTTVVLDRAIGLGGLMLLASVTFFFAWERVPWSAAYRNGLATTLAVIWGGLLVGCVFVFSRRLRHLLRLPELAGRLPAADQILRVGRATVAMRRHKGLVLLSLLNTVLLQLIVVIAACVMAQALNMRGDFTLYFLFVPLGFLIAAIPFTPPQAAGVMEAAYIKFFCWNGLNHASAAVAFALANRLTQLVWALPGILVPLLGAHLPTPAELRAVEQPETREPADPDREQRTS